MVPDLLLVLRLGVLDNLGDEVHKHIFEQFPSEHHLCPIMPLLQNIQHITYVLHVSTQPLGRVHRQNSPLKSIFPSKYASWKICMGIFSFP